MALAYLQSKEPWEVEWRAVLAFLVARKRVTPKMVAMELGLGKEIETVEFRGPNRRELRRTRHTGASEANTRLRRLASWGMARREKDEEGNGIFVVTAYGKEVDQNPRSKRNRKKV